MVQLHFSLRIYCCVHKGRICQFIGWGNAKFAEFVKRLSTTETLYMWTKCAYGDGGTFETPQSEIALKNGFIVNVL